MHDHEITITVVDAQEHEREFEFEEPQLCIVGRAHDCDISTPEGEENLVVSRHHCLLEIDPPTIRVHDLGSTNGTYVNGVKIPPGRSRRKQRSGFRLHDGDEIGVGPVRLRVHVSGEARDQTFGDFALEFDGVQPGQPNMEHAERGSIGRKTRFAQNDANASEADAQRRAQ